VVWKREGLEQGKLPYFPPCYRGHGAVTIETRWSEGPQDLPFLEFKSKFRGLQVFNKTILFSPLSFCS
jgi:hypothetical protein